MNTGTPSTRVCWSEQLLSTRRDLVKNLGAKMTLSLRSINGLVFLVSYFLFCGEVAAGKGELTQIYCRYDMIWLNFGIDRSIFDGLEITAYRANSFLWLWDNFLRLDWRSSNLKRRCHTRAQHRDNIPVQFNWCKWTCLGESVMECGTFQFRLGVTHNRLNFVSPFRNHRVTQQPFRFQFCVNIVWNFNFWTNWDLISDRVWGPSNNI